MDLKSEIMRRVEGLPVEMQRQLLAYFDSFEHPRICGEKSKDLLSLAGALDDTSAMEMSKAIESACETVDACEW